MPNPRHNTSQISHCNNRNQILRPHKSQSEKGKQKGDVGDFYHRPHQQGHAAERHQMLTRQEKRDTGRGERKRRAEATRAGGRREESLEKIRSY
jgi:hypothetical protein